MPCLVKCDPDGIRPDMNVVVRTRSGSKLPRREPKGFSPRDGDRIFLWTIEEGYQGDGLVQRGDIYDFHQNGKTFVFQVRNDEQRIREFRGRDLHNRLAQSPSEASVKEKIRKYRPPTVVELTEGEAACLDQFYGSAPTHARNGMVSPNDSRVASPDNGGDTLNDLVEDLDAVRDDSSIEETTRGQLIQARLGQGKFRLDILRRWHGACAVTGCNQPAVLRASHVRPWRDSSNEQRLNPANGILLSANLDALFDRFLISFNDNGEMRISDLVDRSSRELLGLPAPLHGELTVEERGFLAYHRDRFEQQG